jgi:hypothetical protein
MNAHHITKKQIHVGRRKAMKTSWKKERNKDRLEELKNT